VTGVLLTAPAAGSILTGDTALGSVEGVGVTGPTAHPATALRTSRPTEPGAPSRIVIGAIDVAADVEQLGLAADGTLALPTDPAKVGWYTGSSRPADSGPAVMVGHLDSGDAAAVFARIYKLEVGDDVTVQTQGGSTLTYSVTGVSWYAKASFPSEAVYGRTSDPQLRLITCGGRYDPDSGYSDNVVVFATEATP
jgi:LPXTG-site transpeptidase (sortase) family protein